MYGKLFEQMYDGTLATKGPWQALVTFQQFVILADKRGDVDMTPEAMARRTTIPLEIILEGIKALEEPDADSRSPALEGRRIVRLDEHREWGWNVVNYGHYRKIRSEDERREYMRLYQRKRREAVKGNVNMSTEGEQSQPIAVSSKQEAVSNKGRTPLARGDKSPSLADPVNGNEVAFIPLVGDAEFGVSPELLAELETAYPQVDGLATLKQIRAWCITNPTQRKTRRGVARFINRWFEKDQNHG